MILRIIQRKLIETNGDVETEETQVELILESDSFIIYPHTGEINEFAISYLSKDNGSNRNWAVLYDNREYIFELAYLMNKEGKTIEKYQ